jgi:flagellar hook assembly protein FlgD
VDLAVFDAAGRRVATVVAGERSGGTHEVAWDGTNDAGQRVGAGVYFCRLEAGGRTTTRKLSLLQ